MIVGVIFGFRFYVMVLYYDCCDGVVFFVCYDFFFDFDVDEEIGEEIYFWWNDYLDCEFDLIE